MAKAIKSFKWLMLVSGMIVAILGITILFTPIANLMMLVIFIGVGTLISGISEIISFCNEKKGERSGLMLISGILSTLFGIWVLLGRGAAALAATLPFVFAIWILTSSIIRIVNAISLKKEGFSMWGWVLAFGVLGTVFGFPLLFSPMLSGVIISVALAGMLISHGISNIIMFFRLQKQQQIAASVKLKLNFNKKQEQS